MLASRTGCMSRWRGACVVEGFPEGRWQMDGGRRPEEGGGVTDLEGAVSVRIFYRWIRRRVGSWSRGWTPEHSNDGGGARGTVGAYQVPQVELNEVVPANRMRRVAKGDQLRLRRGRRPNMKRRRSKNDGRGSLRRRRSVTRQARSSTHCPSSRGGESWGELEKKQ